MSWRETCIEEAAAVADRIADRAILYRDMASWVHRQILYANDKDAVDQLPRLMPANPSVYSGTAGVGLMFARLSKFTDDRRHRDMAVRSLLHATRHAIYINEGKYGKIGAEYRFGHYLGVPGIAWAAHEVAELCESEQLARQAERLVAWVGGTMHLPGMVDLMNGLAGGAMSLLAMGDRVPGASELARDFGKDLLSKATHDAANDSLHWTDYMSKGKGLNGFSHGTAGIAWSLAHLWKATGEDAYVNAVEGALRYEDLHFNPDKKNWPNFQYAPDAQGNLTYSAMWCHGAPGIGLSRALLEGLDPRFKRTKDIQAALETSVKLLDRQLREPGLDYQTCHGLGGLLECIWFMKDVLEPGSGKALANRVLRNALEQHGREAYARWGPAVEWPSAVTLGPLPSLVTGTAGIAHLLLRAAEPDKVPTVAAPAGLLRS